MAFTDHSHVGRVVAGLVHLICVLECSSAIVFSLLTGALPRLCFNVCGIAAYKTRKNIPLDKNAYSFSKQNNVYKILQGNRKQLSFEGVFMKHMATAWTLIFMIVTIIAQGTDTSRPWRNFILLDHKRITYYSITTMTEYKSKATVFVCYLKKWLNVGEKSHWTVGFRL